MDTFQTNVSTFRNQSQGQMQSKLSTRMFTVALLTIALRKKKKE